MEVKSGAEWPCANGMRQEYSVSLSDSDGPEISGQPKEDWESSSWKFRYGTLQYFADVMVLKYMREHEVIQQGFFEQRISELRAARPSV